MTTLRKDELKSLKRKKGTKLLSKKVKSSSHGKSATTHGNNEATLNAQNISANNLSEDLIPPEIRDRIRNGVRDAVAQHLAPFLETPL